MSRLWVATERIPRFRALFPDAKLNPEVEVPEIYAQENVTREQALVEIVRGRLGILGPTTVSELATPLALDVSEIDIALLALEQEGFVLRGKFTPDVTDPLHVDINGIEWCERGLLARIHRYTVNRLRAEIEPVTAQDFMRFLFKWQNVASESRKEGPDALAAVLATLEGFEAAAIAWESEILPARLQNYDFTWLDDLCLSGRAGWARLAKSKTAEGFRRTGPVRNTPIALVTRRNMPIWSAAAMQTAMQTGAPSALGSRAQRVCDYLQQYGASFFDEIVDGERMLPSEVEAALAELVAEGRVTSDSFAGMRALLLPLDKRKPLSGYGGTKRRGRTAMFGIQDAGRWSLLHDYKNARENKPERERKADNSEATEYIAQILLRRYGVIFWRLLAREAEWLPPWRDLLRVFRRLEARGEIRGGRFVGGISGEQFALPEALAALRTIRKQSATGELICVSGADPLNLVGLLVPGTKVPALAGNRVLYRDGVAVGVLIADEIQWLEKLSREEENGLQNALIMRTSGAPQLRPLRAKIFRQKSE